MKKKSNKKIGVFSIMWEYYIFCIIFSFQHPLMIILSFVLAGCSYSGDSNDEVQIQEGYDQIENEQIVKGVAFKNAFKKISKS